MNHHALTSKIAEKALGLADSCCILFISNFRSLVILLSESGESRQGKLQEGWLGMDSEATDDPVRFYEKHEKHIIIMVVWIYTFTIPGARSHAASDLTIFCV